MWLFLTRRLRMWVILGVVVPLTSGVLRKLGRRLERRNGPTRTSRALLQAGALGDRARAALGGRRRGHRQPNRLPEGQATAHHPAR
jgi:hypothetical protein